MVSSSGHGLRLPHLSEHYNVITVLTYSQPARQVWTKSYSACLHSLFLLNSTLSFLVRARRTHVPRDEAPLSLALRPANSKLTQKDSLQDRNGRWPRLESTHYDKYDTLTKRHTRTPWYHFTLTVILLCIIPLQEPISDEIGRIFVGFPLFLREKIEIYLGDLY